MKRIISFLTVAAMLIATFAMLAVPATATTSTVDLTALDNKLASWWNFEGDTPLADKAKDTSSDTLKSVNVTFENGAVVIPSAKASYVAIPKGGDFTTLDGKTIYVAYKAEGTATAAAHVMSINGNFFRYWLAVDSTTTDYKLGGQLRDNGGSGTITKLNMKAGTPNAIATGSSWYYTAITFKLDNGTFNVNIYNSADGTNYVVSEQSVANWAGNVNVTRDALLGKLNTTTSTGGGVVFTVDDVRLYNGVLSADEISALASNVPYATAEPEPEEPDVEAVPGLFDENLVAYYDFKGETKEEQFTDKAPYGDTKDDLTYTENVTVTDGVAYIPSAKGEYIGITSTEGDVSDLVGKTIYLEFTAEGKAETYAVDLISANRIFRYWMAKGSTTDSYAFGGGIGTAPTQEGKFAAAAGPAKPENDWYYVAITIEKTDSKLTVIIYNSADGTTYVKNTNVFTGDAMPESLARDVALLIGKNSPSTDDRGIAFNVNELRIYDTVLTEKQVAALSAIDVADYTSVLGWQDKANEETGLLDVRVVGLINVSENSLKKFTEAGFVISAEYAGGTKPETKIGSDSVYTSIIAGEEVITPATYDCESGYLFLLPITNVPVEGTVTFTVKPYCVMNGVTLYGETATITYTNGVIAQ